MFRTAPVSCVVAIGGNQGDVPASIERARNLLNSGGKSRVLRGSSIHRTAAVGSTAGDNYYNAAWVVETTLAPLHFLAELQQVENQLGRTRSQHWGPRTLDLDLVFYGDESILIDHAIAGDACVVHADSESTIELPSLNDPQSPTESPAIAFAELPAAFWNGPLLVVPHPACWYRRFVLDPIGEIAADRVHPLLGQSVAALVAAIKVRPLVVQLCGTDVQALHSTQLLLWRLFADVECIVCELFCERPPSVSIHVQTDGSAGQPGEPYNLQQPARPTSLFQPDAAVTLFLNELTPKTAARCDRLRFGTDKQAETADDLMCRFLAAGVALSEFPAAMMYAQIPNARRLSCPAGSDPAEFSALVLDAMGCQRRAIA